MSDKKSAMTHDPRASSTRPSSDCGHGFALGIHCEICKGFRVPQVSTASPSVATEGQPTPSYAEKIHGAALTLSQDQELAEAMKEFVELNPPEAAQSREAEIAEHLANIAPRTVNGYDDDQADEDILELWTDACWLLAELSHVRGERDAMQKRLLAEMGMKDAASAALRGVEERIEGVGVNVNPFGDFVNTRAETAEERARVAEQALTLALERLYDAIRIPSWPTQAEWIAIERQRLIATATMEAKK